MTLEEVGMAGTVAMIAAFGVVIYAGIYQEIHGPAPPMITPCGETRTFDEKTYVEAGTASLYNLKKGFTSEANGCRYFLTGKIKNDLDYRTDLEISIQLYEQVPQLDLKSRDGELKVGVKEGNIETVTGDFTTEVKDLPAGGVRTFRINTIITRDLVQEKRFSYPSLNIQANY